MSPSLDVHLIEEGSLKGQDISCYQGELKKLLPSQQICFFNTKEEFKNHLEKVMNSLRDNAHTQLLILSAHGKPGTATDLAVGPSNESIDIRHFSSYFKNLPPKLVIYVSACWGGYPSFYQSFIVSQTSKPTTIGPLVSICGKHNIELQDKIIEVLSQHKDYEPKLCEVIQQFNTKWKDAYPGKPYSVSIKTSDDKWVPPRGEGGLPYPISGKNKYLIVALQRHACCFSDGPLSAVLWDGVNYWQVPEIQTKLNSANPYALIGECIEARSSIDGKSPEKYGIAKLHLTEKINRIKKVPERFKFHSYPYEWASEQPCKDKSEEPKMISEVHIKRACKACNWAVFHIGQTRENDQLVPCIKEARCCRHDCDEHNKET